MGQSLSSVVVTRVKQMSQRPGVFIKKTVNYRVIECFGPGLLSTNGDVWKRHRQIAGPAFGIGFDKSLTLSPETSLRTSPDELISPYRFQGYVD